MFRSGPLPLPIGDLPTDLEGKFGTPEAKEAVKVVLGRSGDELTQLDLVLYLSNLLMSAKEIKVNLCLVYVHSFNSLSLKLLSTHVISHALICVTHNIIVGFTCT